MKILCLFGRHDWKTYHRWFRIEVFHMTPTIVPSTGEGDVDSVFISTKNSRLELREVSKCKRCPKKIYVY